MCAKQSPVIFKCKQENGRFIPIIERGYLDEFYGRLFLICTQLFLLFGIRSKGNDERDDSIIKIDLQTGVKAFEADIKEVKYYL